MSHFWIAFGLTLLAGLSTGIGSTIAFFTRKTNTKFLSVTLGLSAGVMIYVSLTEMLPLAHQIMSEETKVASWIILGSFFGGVLFIGIIDMLVPNMENPHEFHKNQKALNAIKKARTHSVSLMRLGILTGIALAIHNFPEGMATFVSALAQPTIGFSIAIAIAIHNIPEGIAVSIPIYYATGSRKKAFIFSVVSGLAEPLGAIIAYLIFQPFLNDMFLGIVFAAVSGVMVYISFDELLPAAEEYGEHHLAILGLFLGMFIIAVSLALL